MALQALSTFATLTADSVTEIDVTVSGSMEENPTFFRIDHENRFVLKTKEVLKFFFLKSPISGNSSNL